MEDTYTDVPDMDPTDGGQVEAVDAAEAVQDGPLLNVDEWGQHRVPIRVDGEEMYVPLAEAVSGYQRQADYTRKTQEVAQQRQELQVVAAIKQALDNDPATTLRTLADHYGIPLGQQAQQAPVADQYGGWGEQSWNEPDPTDSRYMQLEQRIMQFEKQQAQQQIETELGRLKQIYGPEFDPKEVLAQAVATGNSNLEQVYKLIDYDRKAALLKKQQQQATQTKTTTDAKKAAAVVSGGRSASSKPVSGDGPIRTIADAWAAAKRQHGVN